MTAPTDTTPRYLREIIADGACADAVAWARAYPTAEAMWAACERHAWMLWLAGKRAGPEHSESRVRIVRVACEVARLVLPIFEKWCPGDDRPRKAIEAGEAYCANPCEATANAAMDAAASAAAAAAATYAATYAAADVAYAAADVAYAATYAASAATRAGANADVLAIIRKHFPTMPERSAK